MFSQDLFDHRTIINNSASGSICILDFHTIVAEAQATSSFRHVSPAFMRTISVLILSFNRTRAMVQAALHIAQSMLSVNVFAPLSSWFILKGIAAGAAAMILPIRSPLVKVFSRCGGTL